MALTKAARQELIQGIRARYRAGSREAKSRILEEFASVSGYHRKSAIRILNGAATSDEGDRGRRRPRVYDEAARQALIVLWEASDRVCGKRLKALLSILVPALERNGHLKLNAEIRSKLTSMSAATIDRQLRDIRTVAGQRRKRKVPTVLRKSVPIRTFADWNDPVPGFMEIDLVSHCGDVAAGSFAHTLTLTDIASGWTECLPLLFRDSNLVVEAIDGLRRSLPFRLAGIDVDNGGEFLNDVLLRYCTAEGIVFTRSRPYHKNDQAWVEQKNGSVVRRFVGYHRLEGAEAVEALARLYSATRLFVNFFQPSFKLKEKIRAGSRIVKRYHTPETPSSRLLAVDAVSSQVKARLHEITAKLDPLQLLDEIRRVQHDIVRIGEGEHPYAAPPQRDDLSRFLADLSTAWRAGEVRPTHRSAVKPPRHWRTRIDPFQSGWSQICEWLEVDPDLTGLELFERLQRKSPGVYHDGQLRTLQRRLKHWRMGMARSLVFGVHGATNEKFLPPSAADCTSIASR
ncbi:MAG: integrase catalytic domain-containing protein [Vulcanimicrobiaceae bacterium]